MHYVTLLERFDRRERSAGERYPDFLATHPPNAERIETLRKGSTLIILSTRSA
jgi:predicted Zn-dependent protease